MSGPKYVSYREVQKHTSRDSCWIVIDGHVYDAAPIIDSHPGGSSVLLKNAGKDATKAFKPIHPPGTLLQLPAHAIIGPIDPATIPKETAQLTEDEKRVVEARASLPPPSAAINICDIEDLAQKVLSATAWAYYRSAGDDENSYYENMAAFRRFWFRPRILNKVSVLSTHTTMLSFSCSLPIYITPTALARLGHPDGEMNFTRTAAKEGLIQGLSDYASCSAEEVMSVKHPNQILFFQLYMSTDRKASETKIRRLEGLGFKALILTVDAIVAGKRELDRRAKADNISAAPVQVQNVTGTEAGLGVAHTLTGTLDADVCWDDISWIRSLTKLPLLIKGIQSVEDAVRAFGHKVDGIVLSNHGGRSLDFSPSPMTVLYELSQVRPDLLWRSDFEVYVDGGVTRGTDVLKALCLGARAVGMGRPFLYANSLWGEEGCRTVVQIMREEIQNSMRLLGVSSLSQLSPEMVRYVDRDPVRARL
ncbi:hypothetical protein NEOLEDRAFT_1128048 [Neolentinus lepideus HHB14362 ss-1]|uniref:L-lactate dehydrogenase (cytochrome) n=1 Tax=Neolentinus lepideus HHB14362 ss-1 TaxID=1314782 RepID=A0A165V8M3_9AGAM|nr:hypothetical protein NEOLEDRAFT_1128048 [Neolentinus lepideus HHB14362 ss-1]